MAGRTKVLRCWVGNYDGKRQGLVIAYSAKDAIKVIGTSANDFANYWHLAQSMPSGLKLNTLYTMPSGGTYQHWSKRPDWVEGRCEV